MERKCCPNCFGDHHLGLRVIPRLSTEHGKCSFCLSDNQPLVEPSRLAPELLPLVNIYRRDPKGQLLVEWFKQDWRIFDSPSMDVSRAKDLMADVLDHGNIVRWKFSPLPRFRIDRSVHWTALRDELMYRNRHFPRSEVDLDRWGALLGHLSPPDVPLRWYRARPHNGQSTFSKEQMGAPPNRLASHGRANPPGIPYLYLASTLETAVSEIRPHTGAKICVAEFTILPDLVLVDLRDPRRLVSPIALGDEDAIGELRNDIRFLELLGDELTTPVLPEGAAIDYVPSQYMFEFIKNRNYDGVLYKSSVGVGFNLALFYPLKAGAGAVSERVVKSVSVELK